MGENNKNNFEPDSLMNKMFEIVGVPADRLGFEKSSIDMSINIKDRIHSLVIKTEKGEEMFQTDPVFRNCIEVIARGGDPIKVLANVCEMLNNQNNVFIDHMKKCSGINKNVALMPDNES